MLINVLRASSPRLQSFLAILQGPVVSLHLRSSAARTVLLAVLQALYPANALGGTYSSQHLTLRTVNRNLPIVASLA